MGKVMASRRNFFGGHALFHNERSMPFDDRAIAVAATFSATVQTTESFALRQFPCGHFYLQEHRAEFEATLNEDL
jgi:hypothetical protein